MKTESSQSILNRFGSNIRGIRTACNLSQEELAERAGVHRTYIGMIERGEKNVTLLTMYRMAAALNTSVSTLIEGIKDGK